MNFLEKLDYLMQRDGLNKNTLSIKSDVPYTTIDAFYKKGFDNVKMGTVRKIANAFGVTLDYLMNDDISDEHYGMPDICDYGQSKRGHWSTPLVKAYASAISPKQEAACAVLGINHVVPDVDELPDVPTCEMLVYEFPAAAGIPLLAEDDYDRLEFPESAVPSGADFGIRIKGDSMQPTINDGSIVFVRKQPDLQNGQIGIFMIDGEAACKRYFHKGTAVTLRSDNPAYADITIKPFQEFYVAGHVLGYR